MPTAPSPRRSPTSPNGWSRCASKARAIRKWSKTDTLDPIFATIVRLAIDGMWLAENFNLMRFDPNLKAAVGERLIAWTRLQQMPDPRKGGAPAT